MKTKIVVLLFFLSIQQVYSHNYFSDSTTWTENCINTFSQNLDVSYKNQLFMLGDTLMDNHQYKKLYRYASTSGVLFVGAIREIEKKIYFKRNDSEETLLYDFSAGTGDTIWLVKENFFKTYTVVLGTDSIAIDNGEKRKRLRLDSGFWIEGIGSLEGFLSPVSVYLTNGIVPHLVCFKQKGIILFSDPNYCNGDCCTMNPNELYDHIHEISKPGFHIFSIRNEKKLEISLYDNSQETITIMIIDSSGRIVKNSNIRNTSKINVDISTLKSGIYIVTIYLNQKVISQKIEI